MCHVQHDPTAHHSSDRDLQHTCTVHLPQQKLPSNRCTVVCAAGYAKAAYSQQHTRSPGYFLVKRAASVIHAASATCREKKRLEAEALARFEREEEEARIAAEAAAAAER